MQCNTIRWSLYIFIVSVLSLLSASAKEQQSDVPRVSDHKNDPDDLTIVQGDNQQLEGNPFENDITNLTDSSIYSPNVNDHNVKKRLTSSGYETRMESRSFFPVLARPQRPSYGLPSKGYGPPKAPPIGYPAARPPVYRPQPVYRPTQPPHTYGPPKKPTGYPASSHNVQEIYITYPPATISSGSNYGQSTGNNNGASGAIPSGYPSGPSKPNYETPVSFPNPNYETPTYPAFYPVGPSKPDYVPPVTPNPIYPTSTPCYHANNPAYPSPVSQPNYPTYPANPSYPSPAVSPTYPSVQPILPNKPVPAYPSPIVQPAYPSSNSGSSYGSGNTGSSPPVFVFIPKPGYFNSGTGYKPAVYQKPTNTYPAPVPYYPTARPPQVTNTQQYYPAPQPVKPPKPSGVYPAAKPPSTAYGAPKSATPDHQYQNHEFNYYGPNSAINEIPRPIYSDQTGTSYRTDKKVNTPSDYKSNTDYTKIQTVHAFQSAPQLQLARPLQPNELIRFPVSAQPNSFQRGNNLQQRPADSQSVHSSLINDYAPVSPIFKNLGEVGNLPLGNPNQSWPIGEESNQISTIKELASNLDELTLFRDDFRSSLQDRPKKNDCGGSWVVLERPVGSFVDPSQVQVESILPGFPSTLSEDNFNQLLNGQLFRSPDGQGVSFITLPSKFSDQTLASQNINPSVNKKLNFPDLLIFSTTPNSDSNSIQIPDSVAEESWKKPNKVSSSSLPFIPSRLIGVKDFTSPLPSDLSQLLTKEIKVKNPGTSNSIQTLSSTENSIILSLNGINKPRGNENGLELQSVERSPSPFLVDVGNPVIISGNDGDSSEEETTIFSSSSLIAEKELNDDTDPENRITNTTSANDAEKLIRLLRSANLRTLSSLIDQAGIAVLFQDKEFTFIAPSNTAFTQISARQRQRWTNRPELLRETLLYHVIEGHLNSSSLENEATPLTMAGSRRLRVNIYNATESRDSITTFNGARVLTPDLRIGNLLVHVVDRVILPASNPSQTILDILNDGGLQASLLGPSLSRVLSSDATPLTVFVPTTEAFLSVSQDERNLFLNNETAFHNLLWYHMVPGTYYSEGLEDGQSLSTLHRNGRLRVELTRQNRKKKLERINGEANVIESDVSATNGVVHFIDRILTDVLF